MTLRDLEALAIFEYDDKPEPIKTAPGVYFLLNDDRVVYVGSSRNVGPRIKEHRRNGATFDNAVFIPIEDYTHRKAREDFYIATCKPKLNTSGTPRNRDLYEKGHNASQPSSYARLTHLHYMGNNTGYKPETSRPLSNEEWRKLIEPQYSPNHAARVAAFRAGLI